VSSPGNEELDQELDDCLVGPVPSGVNSFEFEGSPPDPSKIPTEDVLGVAALILTGSYKDQEFVRVGYYQNTEYDNEEMKETPPANIMFQRLVRDISAKPRVTRFQIKWCVARDLRLGTRCTDEFTCRDVVPPSQGQMAGAATSATVPSANDLEDSMEVDSTAVAAS
jgi:histone chaperone ASF1